MSDFLKLKKRKDFVRVARTGEKVITTSFVFQAARSLSGANEAPKFGFTTTKKIGHAVVRNRARRRMRAAVREVSPRQARCGTEYVLIGRFSTAECPYSDIVRDLKYAFRKAHRLLYDNHNETLSHPLADSAD